MNLSVAVGIRKTGPAPQMRPPRVGFCGEKNRLWTVSPRPNWLRSEAGGEGTTFFCATIGMMVREIRFQLRLSVTGTTGWTLSRYCDPSSSEPAPQSQLLCSGTLISEAIGLESCLARAWAL